MRIAAQILSAALLAAVAAAQSGPASQTVQPNPQPSKVQNPQPSKVQNGLSKVKSVLKNPFKPKTDAAQTPAKQQAVAKPQTAAPAAKQPITNQAKAAPGSKPNSSTHAKAAPANKQNSSTQAKAVPANKQNSSTHAKASPASKQNSSTQAKAAPANKQNSSTQAKAKLAPATKAAAPTKAKVAHPAKHQAVTAKATPKPKNMVPANKPATAEPAPVLAQSAPKLPSPGKRDPFLSPLAAAAARGPAPNCSTGKRCLVVDQIALKGVVQTKSGNIAMVENAAKRSYYLHENDALFDGAVVKITSDSVTFRQDSNDVLGRPVSKEVVKKVSAPAV